jgi:ABC-type spermidine/putrescine transport system permease subunit II
MRSPRYRARTISIGRPSTSRDRRLSISIGMAVVDSSSAASRGDGLPVTIFALTDRGQAFQAAACTTLLLLVTLAALVLLGRVRGRAALR